MNSNDNFVWSRQQKFFWCAKRVAKWLSDVITKEQANFCDHKAYGSKLYFCRELRWDNKFSFPEKKFYNPKTFFLSSTLSSSSCVFHPKRWLLKQQGDSFKCKKFLILLWMLFCGSVFILVCLDTIKLPKTMYFT